MKRQYSYSVRNPRNLSWSFRSEIGRRRVAWLLRGARRLGTQIHAIHWPGGRGYEIGNVRIVPIWEQKSDLVEPKRV